MTYHRPQTPELSVPALVKWLRSRPLYADSQYTYQDPARCLLGWYLREHNADEAISEAAYETMPDYRAIAEPKPHTFGAALQRAEQLLALPAPKEEPIEHDVQEKETVTLQGAQVG